MSDFLAHAFPERGLALSANRYGCQIGALSKEVFTYAQSQVGEEKMGEIVASIPGLSQFV